MDENERKDSYLDSELTDQDSETTNRDSSVDNEAVSEADNSKLIETVELEDNTDLSRQAKGETFEKQPEFITIKEESVEAKPIKVNKKKKVKLSSVLTVMLALVLISGSTYTIGYYNGQINLNESAINDKIDKLLESNFKADIYQSVKEYIDQTGVNTTMTDADVSEIYKNVGNSIVGITSKSYIYDWFNNQQEATAKGSGVIIDQDSKQFFIVTNYHVVSDATDVVVELAKDQIVDSKLIGYDETTDLAVISIQKSDVNSDLINELKPIAIGDSRKLQIGEVAIAIGNPLGYSNTVTSGIVSAVDRQVSEDTDMTYIQTDAAINPGNSGGALVNSKGELIGINSAKIAETDVEGIGFAIPSDKVMEIALELMDKGYVSRPFIGIGGVDVDENSAKLYNIPMGVLVKYVYEGSPAEKAGLQVMDLIVSMDDKNIYNMEDLTTQLADYKVGDTVKLKIVRNEKEEMEISVVLGEKGTQKQ
ncbi:MAG: hypothetical protein BGO41_07410 [Clostridiales bacterium 38-18]|nr:MAG: hypothetical protein BGO41_07410 [Clostridiales bacterium 38-18]